MDAHENDPLNSGEAGPLHGIAGDDVARSTMPSSSMKRCGIGATDAISSTATRS
jgi:hypothetical protein